MKRFLCVCAALVLILALPMSAHAAEGEDDGGIVGGLLDGLKGLFIPDEAFFESFNDEIQQAVDRKTGGLTSSFQAVMDEFKRLQNDHATNDSVKLTMPDNLLYRGYKGTSVNMLSGIDSAVSWFRGLFSAFVVVVTLISCYRKVVSLFKG